VVAAGHLLTHTAPEDLLSAVAGKVWEWVVPSAALPAVRSHHLISGTIRRAGGVQVRIVAGSAPDPLARSVQPTLEDAYLHFTSRRETRGVR
jgi:ABC-2 type transport system ATP-binding protein